MKRRVWAVGAMTAGLAIVGACWWSRGAQADVSTAVAARGTFVDALQVRGEITAARSVTIIAPSDAGELQIVKLVRSGTLVRKGDTVIVFDGTTIARTIEEKQSELRRYEAEIEQARFDARAKEEANVTAATKARYDVERARLDYSAKDILSRVEAEQRALAVADAQQKLREATAQLESDRASAEAKLAGLVTKRDKAIFDRDKATRQLEALTVTAPSDGIVNILRNWRSGNWMNPQDFKEGDRAWAGASIAELPDVGSLYARARVDEVERGRLAVGQPATVRAEAMPDRELNGHIESISALAKADFTSWPPPRNFDLTVALDDNDERLRPGMTTTIRVATETLRDVIVVPPQAVFSDDGQDIVWVMARNEPQRRPVVIDRRNAESVVIEAGVAEGERLALEDPRAANGGRR